MVAHRHGSKKFEKKKVFFYRRGLRRDEVGTQAPMYGVLDGAARARRGDDILKHWSCRILEPQHDGESKGSDFAKLCGAFVFVESFFRRRRRL